jgi:carnitine 3-dehydrogenase
VPGTPIQTPTSDDTLIATYSICVPKDWVDYNNHMNEARYLEAFAAANDAFLATIGAGLEYVARGQSFFTSETHLRHLNEVVMGENLTIVTQLLGSTGKSIHLFHQMKNGNGDLVATGEHLLVHVDLETRKASLIGDTISQYLDQVNARHRGLGTPVGAGRFVGQPRY